MFELHPRGLHLHIHNSRHVSAGGREGQKSTVCMSILLLQGRSVVALTMAKALYIPKLSVVCPLRRFHSLINDFMSERRTCYLTAVSVFVRSRYPPAAAHAVKSESGSGSGDSRQCGVCQISGAASGAER